MLADRWKKSKETDLLKERLKLQLLASLSGEMLSFYLFCAARLNVFECNYLQYYITVSHFNETEKSSNENHLTTQNKSGSETSEKQLSHNQCKHASK